jgi:hypothetical protein
MAIAKIPRHIVCEIKNLKSLLGSAQSKVAEIFKKLRLGRARAAEPFDLNRPGIRHRSCPVALPTWLCESSAARFKMDPISFSSYNFIVALLYFGILIIRANYIVGTIY